MAETVTVAPQTKLDSSGDPVGGGDPVTLMPIMIAPGNTVREFGDTGDLDQADFTVFFKQRVRVSGVWVITTDVVKDDYTITLRGKTCVARVQDWGSGGVVVLCQSATGQAA